MSRLIGAGKITFAWMTTVADYLIPTAAELNAAIILTGFVRDGSPNTPKTGQTADISDQSTPFNKVQAGTFGGDTYTVELYRDDAADTAKTTMVEQTAGFLVLARFPLATSGTFAVADVVDVLPSTIIVNNPNPIGRNVGQAFVSELAGTDVPNEDFAVAL